MSRSEERLTVGYLGNAPSELVRTFESSGLGLDGLDLRSATKRNNLRSIISCFASPQELAKLLSRLKTFLDNGTQIIIVSDDEYARAEQLFSYESLINALDIVKIIDHRKRTKAPKEFALRVAQKLPVRVINISGKPHWYNEVLALCRAHVPGRSQFHPNKPKITPTSHGLEQGTIQLLQRAFEDFNELEIIALPKGMSGADAPLQIRAISDERRTDFVVKFDFLHKAIEEMDKVTDTCVDEKMPFPHYPPIIWDRCVSNASHCAIVFSFVSRAILFEEYIVKHSSKLAIASIFDGPLRLWRQNVSLEKIPFGDYVEKNIFGYSSDDLVDVFDKARNIDINVLSPKDILQRVKSRGVMPVAKVRSHGDLHLRNIFIRYHSSDIVLIDFCKSDVMPATCDPVTLDVSLGFDIPAKHDRFSDDDLFDIYRPPLLGRQINTGIDIHRADAIEAVRLHAGTLCKELEYGITTIGTLLWRASKNLEQSECAYICASNIAKSIGVK